QGYGFNEPEQTRNQGGSSWEAP
uniref:Zinc finger protein 326 (Fragments) n=1 Tax=Rattus norvegicus TaxID=10116 RepID=ZN326_RAT|nr:RecName: Full=Zinc finger protein 326 [Rattus norvegicus]